MRRRTPNPLDEPRVRLHAQAATRQYRQTPRSGGAPSGTRLRSCRRSRPFGCDQLEIVEQLTHIAGVNAWRGRDIALLRERRQCGLRPQHYKALLKVGYGTIA